MNSGSSAQNDPMVGIASLIQAQTAGKMADLGQNWLDFSKEQFAIGNKRQDKLDDLTARATEPMITSMNNANQWAQEDRARYKSVFQPLQDKFIDKAQNWDSAGKQAEAAAEAKADVQTSFAQQQDQADRAMAARGINPASGAWAGVRRSVDTDSALASAGAQNTARRQLRNQAMAIQGEAINLGNGLPAQAATAMGLGVNAGNAAVSNNLANQNSWRSNIDIMNTGFQGNMTGLNLSGNMWRTIGKDRTDMLNYSDKMKADSMSGLMGGAGSILGMMPWGKIGKTIMN